MRRQERRGRRAAVGLRKVRRHAVLVSPCGLTLQRLYSSDAVDPGNASERSERQRRRRAVRQMCGVFTDHTPVTCERRVWTQSSRHGGRETHNMLYPVSPYCHTDTDTVVTRSHGISTEAVVSGAIRYTSRKLAFEPPRASRKCRMSQRIVCVRVIHRVTFPPARSIRIRRFLLARHGRR